jgi:ribosomal protein L5
MLSNHDCLCKFHYLHASEKVKLNQGSIDSTLNSLVINQKYISALYFSMMNIFLQKPFLKRAKKSHASFKLRANMIIGTKLNFHGDRLLEFKNKCLLFILPEETSMVHTRNKKSKLLKSHIHFGLKSLSKLTELFQINVPLIYLGGADIKLEIISRLNRKLKADKRVHLFFGSTLRFKNKGYEL